MDDNEKREDKTRGDIEMAVTSAFPMIDQIAVQARSQAQRASSLAMHEYRRKLQGIVLDMQDNVREEGAKLAEQIRQAVLLQAEEKALDLVDDFVHGRQAEAEKLSQTLFMSEEQAGEELLELEEAPAAVPVNDFPVAEKREENPDEEPETEQREPVGAKEPDADAETDDQAPRDGQPVKTTAFDFANFISRSQS